MQLGLNGSIGPLKTRPVSILRQRWPAREERARQRSPSSRETFSWPTRTGRRAGEKRVRFRLRAGPGTTSSSTYVTLFLSIAVLPSLGPQLTDSGLNIQLSTEKLQAMLANNKDELIRVLQKLLDEDADREMIEMQS